MTRRGARASFGAVHEGRRARQEHVRARPAVLDVPPPDRGHRGVPRAEVRAASPTILDGQPRRVPGRAGTSARRPRTSPSPTRSRPPRWPPGTYRNITGNIALAYGLVAAAQRAGLPLFLGSYPITPASDILHELSRHKRFGVTHVPGRGRDRRHRRGARRGVRRRARRHHDVRPGRRAQGRDDRPGRVASSCRWSSSTSSAAGRRPACRPRPSSPTCCRRCSAATASRRCRSSRRGRPADCFDAAIEAVADRDELPHAGVPALRRLPRQRLRAVARCPTSPTCPTSTVEFATEPNDTDDRASRVPARTCATRTTLARPWAVPGTPGLEHRIGGIEKADGTGNISYDPANHELMVRAARGQGRRHRRRHPRRSRSTTRRGAPQRAGPRLGLDLRPDRAPPCRAVRSDRRARSRRRTCATSTRSRPTPARCSRRYDKVLVPGDEHGPARHAAPRAGSWSTSDRFNQVRGLPFTARARSRVIEDDRSASMEPSIDEHRPRMPADRSRAGPHGRGPDLPTTPTSRPRDFKPTRRSAGAPAAATTRSSPPSRASCPSSGITRENIVFVSGHRLLVAASRTT